MTDQFVRKCFQFEDDKYDHLDWRVVLRDAIRVRKRAYYANLSDAARERNRTNAAAAYHQREDYAKNYRATRGAECRQRRLDRTASIRAKAINRRLPWTLEDDTVAMNDTYSAVEAAAILGRTPRAVEIRRSKIMNGLVRTEWVPE